MALMDGVVGLLQNIAANITSLMISIIPIRCTVTRAAAIAHRTAITAADKLVVSVAALVSADVAIGGSLAHTTTYKSAYSPSNQFGPAGVSAIGSVGTAADANNTHCVDITVPQVVGAAFYEIFLSIDAAPLWVARVTEAQRAAGVKVTALGIVASPSAGVAAGDVRVAVVGTGAASNHVMYNFNNAYVTSGIIGVSCVGYELAMLDIYMYVADLRSAPSLVLAILFEDDAGIIYVQEIETILLLSGAVGTALYHTEHWIDCLGATKMYVLVDSIAGQNAACSIKVERC